MVKFTEDIPDRNELVDLYDAVSWTAYTDTPDVLHRAVAGSAFVVTARDGDRLVGLLRAISDDATIAYLQDLLVRPTHQRRGIGRSLVAAFHRRYGHVWQRVLLTDDEPGQRAFYEGCDGIEKAFGVRLSDAHATLGYSADTTTCAAVQRIEPRWVL